MNRIFSRAGQKISRALILGLLTSCVVAIAGPIQSASALTWSDISGPAWNTKDWTKIRTNADGSVIGVVSAGASNSNVGDLYLSRDAGATWVNTSTSSGALALAVSGDGNTVIAARDSILYRASYSGSAWSFPTPRTWSSPTGSGLNQRCVGYGPNFNSLAASNDGSTWVAGVRDESCVYTSTNSGADWSNTNVGGTNWGSAISADGTVKITSNQNGNIYRNSGSGWGAISTSGLPGSTGWSGIACNSTCTKMAVYSWGGYVWTSSDSGATWSKGSSAIHNYSDVTMSSDGSVIVATDGNDIYITQDLGANWSSQGQGSKSWVSVTVSGNGKRIYAAATDGTIRKTSILSSQTITFSDPSAMTFGGADQALTASSSSGLTVTFASSTPSVCSVASNAIRIVTAGTCTITANQAGDSVYGPATQVSKTLTISKASSSVSVSGSTTFTYNGLPQGPTSSTVTGSTGAVTYSYIGVAPTVYSASATKPTTAGTYAVTATVAADANYLSASSVSTSFSIAKANLAVIPDAKSVSYGSSAPSYTFTYSGFVNSESASSSSFTTGLTPPTCSTSNPTYSSTTPVSSTPTISCSGGSSTNYVFTYSATALLTITKANPTFTSFTLSNSSPVYGTVDTITSITNLPGSVGFSTGAGVISGCASVATTLSAPYTATCSWIPSSTSSTTLTATLVPIDSTSFNTVSTTLTQTPLKAAITVTPTASQSKVYGTADPVIAYTITSGALVGTDTLSGALTYTSAGINTAIGNYQILIGTLANPNYTITLAPVNFTIAQATQGTLSLTTTTATYNPTSKTIALSGTGGLGGGSYSYAISLSNTTPGCSVSGTTLTYTTAGSCVVAVTRAASGNYASTTTPVTVSITQASQTITFSSITQKTFSTTPFAATPSASSALTPTLTSTTTGVCTVSGLTITMVSAGTCSLTANQVGDTNYSAATAVSTSFTIVSGSQSTLVASAAATSANSLSATPSFSTTGGLGTGAVTYAVSNGTATSCQLSNSSASATLSVTAYGTCLITATKAADSAYNAATSAAITFTFNGNPASAPINLVATATSGAVALTWTHVDTLGSSPITDFSIQYAVNSGAWAQFTHTASTIDSITVTGLTNGTLYSFRVAAITLASAGTYSATATAKPLGLAFTPVFGLPTSTATGFTVNITNWNPAFVWGNAQVTSGTATVSVGTGANGILPVTVSGMSPGASASISITASQTNYSDGTAYAAGNALKAALIPDVTGVVATTSGLTATIANFDSAFTWVASATSGNAAVSANGAIAVTGVNPQTAFTLSVTTSRLEYASGLETITATTLQLLRIFYDGNGNTGGSVPTDATTYQSSASGTILGNTGPLTKSGYTFLGWTTNSANTGQVYVSGNAYSLGLTSVTLYAKWSAIPYTVTYQSTDATSGTAPLDQSAQGIQNIYNICQNAPILANSSLVRTGYSFGGWADNYPRTGTIYQSGGTYPITTNNVALYPIWIPNTYTVTYNVNSASGSPSKATDSYTTAGTAITLATVGTMAKTGYAFTGWGRTAVSTPITGTLTVTTDTTLYAQWTIRSYAITYLPGTYGTGTVPTQANVLYGSTFTLAAPTGLTGTDGTNSYAFVAWDDGSGTTYAAGKSYLVGAAPVSLTALWTRIYNVKYSFNGGSVVTPIADQQKFSGDTITVTSVVPTRTGYTFVNWIDQSGLTAASGDTYTVTANNYLLYAQWSAISYPVTYDTASGSTPPTEPSHTIGQIFTVAAAPTKSGYDFAGWSNSGTIFAAGSPFQVGSSNITLLATWTPQIYQITYDFNGGFGTAISPTNYTFATPALPLPASGPTRPDYTFSGWSTGTTGASVGTTFTPSSSITLHAVWVSSVYRITFDAGSGFSDSSTAKVTIGQPLTLPSGSRTNYNLAGWSTQQSGGSLLTGSYTPAADGTLYAQWTLKLFVVTFNGNGGSAAQASGSMAAGTTSPITLPTATRANYVFTGWYSDPQSGYLIGTSGASFTPTDSITAYAHWVQASLSGMGAATQIAQVTVHAGYENSFTAGSNGSTVTLYYPADGLPDGSIITAYLENTTSHASTLVTTPATLILSLVVAWVAPDGTVPATATGKPLTLTISNPNITAGSKVYGYLSGVMTYVGTAAVDGSAVITISQDPVLVVAITTPDAPTGVTATPIDATSATVSWNAPVASGGSAITGYTVISSGGQSCTSTTTSCVISGLSAGTSYTFTVTASNALGTSTPSSGSASIQITRPVVSTPAPTPVVVVDNSAAISAAAQAAADAAAKALAEKKAADALAAAKALADQQASDAAKALADKQAQEAAAKALADQQAADAVTAKAAKDAADKAAAEAQAAKDAAAAAARVKPAVTLYSLTPKLTLSAYDTAYLQRYVRSLKNGASVNCVGYIYKKGTTLAKATALAKSQATAVCALMKKTNKTLKTSISVVDSSKAPKGAVGSKWVAVSYRIDGFKTRG